MSFHHNFILYIIILSLDVCLCPIQRAILKFARYTGAHPIAGRFTPGTFTNQIQAAFREPRILIVSDPRADHQVLLQLGWAMYVYMYKYAYPGGKNNAVLMEYRRGSRVFCENAQSHT